MGHLAPSCPNEAAQAELEELAEGIRQEGFMVEVAPIDVSFHAKLEEGAGHVAV